MSTRLLDLNPPAHLQIGGQNLTGRAVVLRNSSLPSRLRSFRHRVWEATGVSCDQDLSRTTVFCKNLFDGREDRFGRGDVLRFATVEEIRAVTLESDGH